MERKQLNRIGLVAAALLVPGGFLLGAAVLARRKQGSGGVEKEDADERSDKADPA